jgi:hypothetical protein
VERGHFDDEEVDGFQYIINIMSIDCINFRVLLSGSNYLFFRMHNKLLEMSML